MAEERLIDADKDKKYKIRKNADGEDELYIDGDYETEEEVEELEFALPDEDEDDEEIADLTPEQAAALIKEREEQERKTQAEIERLCAILDETKQNEDWDGAARACDSLLNLDAETEWAYGEKLVALTCNFNDYSLEKDIISTANGLENYGTDEQKAQIDELAGEKFQKELATTQDQTAKLKAELDEKRQQRLPAFKKSAISTGIFFGISLALFVTALVLALHFYGIMYADQNGTNIIYTIVFGALTLIFFAILLIATRKFCDATRLIYLNNRDDSTELGREYVASKSKLATLIAIKNAITIKQ